MPGAVAAAVAAVAATGVSATQRSKYAGPDDAWNRERSERVPLRWRPRSHWTTDESQVRLIDQRLSWEGSAGRE